MASAGPRRGVAGWMISARGAQIAAGVSIPPFGSDRAGFGMPGGVPWAAAVAPHPLPGAPFWFPRRRPPAPAIYTPAIIKQTLTWAGGCQGRRVGATLAPPRPALQRPAAPTHPPCAPPLPLMLLSLLLLLLLLLLVQWGEGEGRQSHPDSGTSQGTRRRRDPAGGRATP